MAWVATLGDSLRELFLCNNRVRRVEGLEQHGSLQMLELGSNRIREIEVGTILFDPLPLALSAQGMEHLGELLELWIGRNKLSKVSGLENLRKLRKLSFQSNRLLSLEGLDSLTELREFYCSHNGIRKIEGLTANREMEILDLSNNEIEKIENIEVRYSSVHLSAPGTILTGHVLAESHQAHRPLAERQPGANIGWNT
eukprot:scaffold3969_cov363-Prasinococcus_capsulatus_cf.AAC.4